MPRISICGLTILKRLPSSKFTLIRCFFFLLEASSTFTNLLYFVFKRSPPDRKSTRLNSSHVSISYAVFCLKKKNELLHCPWPEQHTASLLEGMGQVTGCPTTILCALSAHLTFEEFWLALLFEDSYDERIIL